MSIFINFEEVAEATEETAERGMDKMGEINSTARSKNWNFPFVPTTA